MRRRITREESEDPMLPFGASICDGMHYCDEVKANGCDLMKPTIFRQGVRKAKKRMKKVTFRKRK